MVTEDRQENAPNCIFRLSGKHREKKNFCSMQGNDKCSFPQNVFQLQRGIHLISIGECLNGLEIGSHSTWRYL